MRIFIDVVDPLGIEIRRSALNAMHLVTLVQQKLG
jgi:hypothetical protein